MILLISAFENHVQFAAHSIYTLLQLTKIFRFETAHAIHGYAGKCAEIHGHSYELHVKVCSHVSGDDYLPGTGFVMDFKDLKKAVVQTVIDVFDHKIILSENYLAEKPVLRSQANLVVWQTEPSAENMLVFIRKSLAPVLPQGVMLCGLKLYETADSYAEWNPGM